VKPKAVLAYCREKGIKAVDIRFPDGLGRWRHFTMPVAGLTESVFETGLGHESCGFQRGTDDHAPWIVTPVPEAKYIDPLQSEPTLVLMASIQEAWTGEEAWFDVRSLAGRTLEAFRGSGIADEVLVATTLPFDLTHPSDHLKAPDGSVTLAPKSHSPFEGGRFDPDASFRSYLMHMAIESGLAIDRHYRGRQSSSEFSLGAKSLVQACDDQLMLESLMETNAQQQSMGIEASTTLFSKSAWTFTKNSEPILAGSRPFGLSDLGWYAAGGLLKHASALTAIAACFPAVPIASKPDCLAMLSDRNPESFVGTEPVANDPRYRCLVVRCVPARSCPYLTLSAVAMAMLDGIIQKTAPITEPSKLIPDRPLAECLAEDSGFLMHAEVFSERLIESLHEYLSDTSP
jgi:glutamine synthetase